MATTRSRARAPAGAPAAAPAAKNSSFWPLLKDIAVAMKLVLRADRKRLLRCFVVVPAGLLAMLAACFGVDCLLAMGNVSFPASVACLVVLFVALLLCDRVLGSHRTSKLVHLINIPGGWSLRWMNIFFTPAYVMLPLSPRISATEVGKIIAVFLIGFIVMFVFSAYMTRFIQLLKSPPRKAMQQKAGAVQQESTELTSLSGGDDRTGSNSGSGAAPAALLEREDDERAPLMPGAPPRSHAAAYITVRGQNLDDPLSSFSDVMLPPPRIAVPVRRPQRPRAERWAEWANGNADLLLFFAVFLLVGVPVYYAGGYAMPLQLSVNVLMFLCVMELPPSWRQVLHPVIVSAFATLLWIWLLGRIRGDTLAATLAAYRPRNTYLKLWHNAASAHPQPLRPGAGDMLSSIMDASIVSLALPMYQYRNELRSHFVAIVLPNVVISVASLFAYPVICHAIGISPERSLAFTARSLTLALATPAVSNLGGDLNTVSAIAIISGVIGVLIGRQTLTFLRIPEDDYVTRGVAFGANASALGTALLLRVDPPAAAISSLAMSLFGAITVTFSSIPAMVHIIRSLVGLS